jgi:hypothetical protein
MMNKKIQLSIGPTIYQKINATRMSESERRAALLAMRDAELIVDFFLWVGRKIEQLGARLFLRPDLKH